MVMTRRRVQHEETRLVAAVARIICGGKKRETAVPVSWLKENRHRIYFETFL